MSDQRHCPVCGNPHKTELFSQRFYSLSPAHPLEAYTIAACKGCGMGYADNIPSQAVLNAFYNQSSKYTKPVTTRTGGPPPIAMATAGTLLSMLPNHNGLNLLDIGCGGGHLLAALYHFGLRNLSGMDPSKDCIESIRQQYSIPVTLKRGSITDAPHSWRECFDVVTLTGVLEHIRDLPLALQSIVHVLKPCGKLYVEVPDVLSFVGTLRANLDAPFQQFSLEHINYFSLASLDTLLARHGFGLIAYQKTYRDVGGWQDIVVSGLWELVNGYRDDPIHLLDGGITARALKDYIGESQTDYDAFVKRLHRAVKGVDHLAVWGGGTFGLRVLQTEPEILNKTKVIIDNNPIADKILTPHAFSAITAYNELPIVILAPTAKAAIHQQITDTLPNRVLAVPDI